MIDKEASVSIKGKVKKSENDSTKALNVTNGNGKKVQCHYYKRFEHMKHQCVYNQRSKDCQTTKMPNNNSSNCKNQFENQPKE